MRLFVSKEKDSVCMCGGGWGGCVCVGDTEIGTQWCWTSVSVAQTATAFQDYFVIGETIYPNDF